VTSPTLVGERVVLRAPREEDIEERRRHGRVADLMRGYGAEVEDGPMSAEDARGWYERLVARASDTVWVIEHEARSVGMTFLHEIDEGDQRARFAIGFFDPSAVGRGLGRQTTLLVLDHAFDDLGLHRVDLLVLDFNTRAIASYESCGFVLDGRLRESCFMGGRRYDDLVMSVLAHEHRARRRGTTA
jgi:RimJ/RimL family protein N-acetyltransferase